MLNESQSDADDSDDDQNIEAQEDQPQQQNDDHTTDDAGTPSTESVEVSVVFCEVCLAQPRDTRFALVPCGHQRFCESCVNEMHNQGQGCPICRTPINMLLRMY